MKKNITLALFSISLILILSLSFVSAFLFSDFLEKITGHVVAECTDSDVTDEFPDGKNYYLKGYIINEEGIRSDDVCNPGPDTSEDDLLEYFCTGNPQEPVLGSLYRCPNGCINGLCIPEECVPETLAETCGSSGCGIKINNCGEEADCGTCNAEEECLNGVCIEGQEECTDSDGGWNYYVKGEVRNLRLGSSIRNMEDLCVKDNYGLNEYTENYLWEMVCDADYIEGPFPVIYCPNGCEDGACIGRERDCVPEWRCSPSSKDFPSRLYIGGDCRVSSIVNCPDGCEDGACLGCIPDCTGKECGSDGCGGSCESCTGTETCINGVCVLEDCVPETFIETCGSSVCGTKINNCGEEADCGTCDEGFICSEESCIKEEQINLKSMSKYSNKEAFLISDKDWKDVFPWIPITIWTGDENCQRGYGTPENVCVYPTLIFHEEETGFDADSIIYFMQQYSSNKVTIIGETPKELDNLLIAEPEIGAGLKENQIQIITNDDYLYYWESFGTVLYVEDNYELALLASTYASLINVPLIIKGTEYDSVDTFTGRNVICVGSVSPAGSSCSEQYTLEQLQQKYADETNTDKIILVNSDDLDIYHTDITYDKITEEEIPSGFTPEKSSADIFKLYAKNSLAAPILASAKHELILPINSEISNDPNKIRNFLKFKINNFLPNRITDSDSYIKIPISTLAIKNEEEQIIYQNEFRMSPFFPDIIDIYNENIVVGIDNLDTTIFVYDKTKNEKKIIHKDKNKDFMQPRIDQKNGKWIAWRQDFNRVNEWYVYNLDTDEQIKIPGTQVAFPTLSNNRFIAKNGHNQPQEYYIFDMITHQEIITPEMPSDYKDEFFPLENEREYIGEWGDFVTIGKKGKGYITIMAIPEAIPYRKKIYKAFGQDFYRSLDTTEYGSLSNDYLQPDIAIGRIMGISISDVSSYLARDIFYEEILKTNNIKLMASSLPNRIIAANNLQNIFSSIGYNALSSTFEDIHNFDPADWENQDIVYYIDHGGPAWAGIQSSEIPNIHNSIVLNEACLTCSTAGLDSMSFCMNAIRKGALGHYGAVSVAWGGAGYLYLNTLNNIYYNNLDLGSSFTKDYGIKEGETSVSLDHPAAYFMVTFTGDPTLKLQLPYLLEKPLNDYENVYI